jgi:O-methyltransferase involved in polyketide biosynthesis
VAPTCERVPVVVDLREDWPEILSEVGFDASQPTAWVVEGLLMYLTRDESDQLLGRIAALSAPGSRLASEYFGARWDESFYAMVEGEAGTWHLLMTSFRYGPIADTPADWLRGHGWTPGQTTNVVEEAVKQGGSTSRPIAPHLEHPRPAVRRHVRTATRLSPDQGSVVHERLPSAGLDTVPECLHAAPQMRICSPTRGSRPPLARDRLPTGSAAGKAGAT